MLALTIRQPWASLVVLGFKTEEYRFWTTPYRGPLAIHAAGGLFPEEFARLDRAARQFLRSAGIRDRHQLVCGHVLGQVQLLDVIEKVTPWGRFAWQLADPVEWLRPERVRGQQGLWNLE